MNCGDIEENPGVLDQCYSNNNFVTTAVLGVRNYVLLETRLREFNRTAVDVGTFYTKILAFFTPFFFRNKHRKQASF